MGLLCQAERSVSALTSAERCDSVLLNLLLAASEICEARKKAEYQWFSEVKTALKPFVGFKPAPVYMNTQISVCRYMSYGTRVRSYGLDVDGFAYKWTSETDLRLTAFMYRMLTCHEVQIFNLKCFHFIGKNCLHPVYAHGCAVKQISVGCALPGEIYIFFETLTDEELLKLIDLSLERSELINLAEDTIVSHLAPTGIEEYVLDKKLQTLLLKTRKLTALRDAASDSQTLDDIFRYMGKINSLQKEVPVKDLQGCNQKQTNKQTESINNNILYINPIYYAYESLSFVCARFPRIHCDHHAGFTFMQYHYLAQIKTMELRAHGNVWVKPLYYWDQQDRPTNFQTIRKLWQIMLKAEYRTYTKQSTLLQYLLSRLDFDNQYLNLSETDDVSTAFMRLVFGLLFHLIPKTSYAEQKMPAAAVNHKLQHFRNPVCLNKTLEAALNFRPPSNSKRSAGSVPAWKLVNPANKDSTASPAVMRKTLAAVLEMSLLLRGPSHCMHLPCLKSRAVLLALQAPGSPALLTKSVCGGKEQSSWEPSLAPCRMELPEP
ncbi:hypothetical protein Anapl_13149 [Anas platyrhynchos]|uniref:Uncharacterized protein n=1 Tax=Anas platyrhynchos TaxID=8839 RepID=R0LVY1_ANAPL|nr:hypothetical protein Anapl_13149 [Anas platyrhynchos]